MGHSPGNLRAVGVILMQSQTYEITFAGQAGVTLRAEFDDCVIIMGPDTTTLRAQLPDQAALYGLVNGSPASDWKWCICTWWRRHQGGD